MQIYKLSRSNQWLPVCLKFNLTKIHLNNHIIIISQYTFLRYYHHINIISLYLPSLRCNCSKHALMYCLWNIVSFQKEPILKISLGQTGFEWHDAKLDILRQTFWSMSVLDVWECSTEQLLERNLSQSASWPEWVSGRHIL